MLALILAIGVDALWEIFDIAWFATSTPMNPHLTWWAFVVAGCLLPILSASAHISQYLQGLRDQKRSDEFFTEQLNRSRQATTDEMKATFLAVIKKPAPPEQKVEQLNQQITDWPTPSQMTAEEYAQRRRFARSQSFRNRQGAIWAAYGDYLKRRDDDPGKGNAN